MKAITSRKIILQGIMILFCINGLFSQNKGFYGGYPHPHANFYASVNVGGGGCYHPHYGSGFYHPYYYHPYGYHPYGRFYGNAVMFQPYWRPGYVYHRRWVYFPRYNFYWDNMNNMYLFWNGAEWISSVSAPPMIVNVNLSKEKNYELSPDEDKVDDVYRNNDQHQTEYKAQ